MTSHLSRREMLQRTGLGFGFMALAGLCSDQAKGDYTNPLDPKAPHFAPKAKRVIFACMQGGPSHVDTFDYKPELAKRSGQDADGFGGRKLMGSPFKFQQHGQSGLWMSELVPNLAKHADDMCVINSMWTDVPNHPQAFLMMHTGEFRFARPSMGSWVLYGLGTENQSLPGFVTMNPPVNVGGAQNYASGFLPAIYQGTVIGNSGAPIGNLDSQHITRSLQREQLDLVQAMNRDMLHKKQVDPQLEGVIESYELAFRMQDTLPEVMQTRDESQATLDAYGINNPASASFGRQCLLARRMAEAGVRFIEIGHGNWDQHGSLRSRLTSNCEAIDQPLAALLNDLKARDMLKDTLVIWGGEFGRTPHVKNQDGRDHNSTAYSIWMAGGGVKAGQRFGQSDEFGIKAIEEKLHPHDLQATILHLLGLDHERLTYRYGGRDYKLTGPGGARIVDGLIA